MKKYHSLLLGLFLASISPASAFATDGMFNRLDRDKDQVLYQTEFAWMMGERSPVFVGFTKRTYREFFRADLDQSGSVTRSEFADWVRKPRRDLPAELVERFFIVDRNRDEMLDAKEFAKLYRPAWKVTDAAREVVRLDANADGKLTRRECFRYLPVDRATLLGMRVADADQLLNDVSVSAFVWREGDIAYPYDPIPDQVQPLFFWGVDGGIITDCTLRINLSALREGTPQEAIDAAAQHGLTAVRPAFPRMKDCGQTFAVPENSDPNHQMLMPQLYCPDYDPILGLGYRYNFGRDLPNELFLEIGSFGGKLEVLSIKRGAESMVFIQ
jgi:Ca2+-binding EF-hand superfamily protein